MGTGMSDTYSSTSKVRLSYVLLSSVEPQSLFDFDGRFVGLSEWQGTADVQSPQFMAERCYGRACTKGLMHEGALCLFALY